MNSNIDWNNTLKKEIIGMESLDLGEVHKFGFLSYNSKGPYKKDIIFLRNMY